MFFLPQSPQRASMFIPAPWELIVVVSVRVFVGVAAFVPQRGLCQGEEGEASVHARPAGGRGRRGGEKEEAEGGGGGHPHGAAVSHLQGDAARRGPHPLLWKQLL